MRTPSATQAGKPAPRNAAPLPLEGLRGRLTTPLGSRGGATIATPPAGRPAAQPPRPPSVLAPPTFFQTSLPYDGRIDLKTSFVAYHGHGQSDEQIRKGIESWRFAGYSVYRMLFVGSDAGRHYIEGRFDGTPHPDEVETDAEGRLLQVGDRPYMVPTAGWIRYLKEQIRQAVAAGADGILPEEPLLHASSGYSPAFKELWQREYETPWEAPHSSPSAFFRASRLKAELYLRAVNELRRYTRELSRDSGREIRFLLPVHSGISYANWGLLFPHAAAARTDLDGMIAQVWSGPARYPLTYEGRTTVAPFESSWLMYGQMAGLFERPAGVAGEERGGSLYLLADPADDEPEHSWPEYERWYKECLVASLLMPQARGYEVMPWPERVFLPGYGTARGAEVPPSYLAQLGSIAAALQEMPGLDAPRWEGGTRGIGVVTLDTLMWQRGGPSGSSMRSLHGLVLPLLKRGMPVEVVPGERAREARYLARFRVLLVSYDAQKPLDPEVNRALAAWTAGGGSLVVVGGEDAYNAIGEWWNRAGFEGPTEHLLRQCDAKVELPRRMVRGGRDRYTIRLTAGAPVRNLENRRTHTLRVSALGAAGKPLYLRFADEQPRDGWGAWLGRVRVLDGGRVRADFRAGSPAERIFLATDGGSKAGNGYRFADGEAFWVYRFNRLGPDAVIELELGNQYSVATAAGEEPAAVLEPAGGGLPPARAAGNYPLVLYPLAGAEALLRLRGEEGAAAWGSPHGSGSVLYCGLPAAYFADGKEGAELLRGLVRHAAGRARLQLTEGPFLARRGPYVVAHPQGRAVRLRGSYLNLFDPELPVVENPALPLGQGAFYKSVQLPARTPTVLHATHRLTVLESGRLLTRLRAEGPEGAPGRVRLDAAGMAVAGIDATEPPGVGVEVETKAQGATVLLSYPQSARGVTINIRWRPAEQRLTK